MLSLVTWTAIEGKWAQSLKSMFQDSSPNPNDKWGTLLVSWLSTWVGGIFRIWQVVVANYKRGCVSLWDILVLKPHFQERKLLLIGCEDHEYFHFLVFFEILFRVWLHGMITVIQSLIESNLMIAMRSQDESNHISCSLATLWLMFHSISNQIFWLK